MSTFIYIYMHVYALTFTKLFYKIIGCGKFIEKNVLCFQRVLFKTSS